MGVIGSIYALRMAKAGFSVTCLARGERLASLRKNGLVIHHNFLNDEESVEISVTDSVPPGSNYDIILVTVRSGQILNVLEQLRENKLSAQAVAVVGNNLENLQTQAGIFGHEHFVAGFGAFGGYRKDDCVYYLDGRTVRKNSPESRVKSTLGIIDAAARPALELVSETMIASGCPVCESPDIQSWYYHHAALVFPLAGAMYAADGDQQRFCRTRDAIVLGVRACHECIRALYVLGYSMQPKSLKSLAIMPEWLLVSLLSKRMNDEAARTAMFGHANAPGGHDEISGQATVFDTIISDAGIPLPSWKKLLPCFSEKDKDAMIPDGSRTIRLKIW